jgi:signal transduction histidine kinase
MDPVAPDLAVAISRMVDQTALFEICRVFHELLEIPVRIFDIDGNLLAEDAREHPVCELMRETARGRAACDTHRLSVKNRPPGAGDCSDCFCGLRYGIVPIAIETEVLGRIVFGPYLPAQLERIPRAAAEIDPGGDRDRLRGVYGSARRLNERFIARVAQALRSSFGAQLFSAHRAFVTGELHLAAVRESYRELTEKNRELAEMNERMRQFERQKSNFLAMVSHELRTPLTSIIGYSEMLTEGIAGSLGDEQRQFVETIKTKGDELLRLISSILDFSQTDTGHLSLQPVECRVPDLIERSVHHNRELADRRGVALSVDVPADLPPVLLDPEKIRTAVGHLLDNAIKFSRPGGLVAVTARVVPATQADGAEDGFGLVLMATPDMLEISVQDCGSGIPDHALGRVFDPFTQIDGSSTREHGGAGLGLTIVKHYVEAHGGHVVVTSAVGEGSRFTIRLPIQGAAG